MDLSGLNPEQRRAVEHDAGPILVLAGAGSGKTRVITSRIARLVSGGVRPENILGVTFTNKAAAEMRERVAQLIPPDQAKRVHLGTFHALGARILRSEIEALGFDKRFHILDEGDRRRVIKQVLKELNLAGDGRERRVLSIISRAKNARCTPASLPEARYNAEMPRAQRAFDQYNVALRNLNAVDFDDLLLLPTRIFEERPEVREKYRQRFRYVLVDEYQDTNPIQMVLLEHLVGPPHFNLMAVGDDDQSIYRFRGAVADNILRFGEQFRGATIIALEQNYRSTTAVLNLANAVIALNTSRHAKTLWSDLGAGRPVEVVELMDDFAEADWIARKIREIAQDEGRPYDRFAVLYRSNGQAGNIEEALKKHDVPYRLLGGQSVFDRKEIKDVAAYMQLVLNPRDDLAMRRVVNYPTRGIGTGTMATLDQYARAHGRRLSEVLRDATKGTVDVGLSAKSGAAVGAMFAILDQTRARVRARSPSDLPHALRDMVDALGLKRAIMAGDKNPNVARIRWANVDEMFDRVGRVSEGDTAWAALEDYVQLMTLESSAASRERDDEIRNRVTLTTIHSSKGLEFPIVYLSGMSDDLLPHKNAIDEPGGEAEERRLAYVGITRAKERLIISHTRIRRERNERLPRQRSRFLDDLPPGLWEERSSNAPSPWEQKKDEENAEMFASLKALLDS